MSIILKEKNGEIAAFKIIYIPFKNTNVLKNYRNILSDTW